MYAQLSKVWQKGRLDTFFLEKSISNILDEAPWYSTDNLVNDPGLCLDVEEVGDVAEDLVVVGHNEISAKQDQLPEAVDSIVTEVALVILDKRILIRFVKNFFCKWKYILSSRFVSYRYEKRTYCDYPNGPSFDA